MNKTDQNSRLWSKVQQIDRELGAVTMEVTHMRKDLGGISSEIKAIAANIGERSRTDWRLLVTIATVMGSALAFYTNQSLKPLDIRDELFSKYTDLRFSRNEEKIRDIEEELRFRTQSRWSKDDHFRYSGRVEKRFERLEKDFYEREK